ncbi:MAG: imidazolonepropionase, partial [Deltaproteobacteria bacterium]
MPLLTNIASLATCRPEGAQDDIHAIPRAALAWEDGRILWAGPEADVPARLRGGEQLDAGGRLVIPGLVDCHTHLAFAGWRADEFERRLRGESYLEIAAAGGGIAATVQATRAASDAELAARAAGFLEGMLSLGVTTVECKSGYGLDEESELRLLRVYARLSELGPQRLVPTLLAAHVVPPEYRDRRAAYVALVTHRIIPAAAAARLARCCDVFVEESAFT